MGMSIWTRGTLFFKKKWFVDGAIGGGGGLVFLFQWENFENKRYYFLFITSNLY